MFSWACSSWWPGQHRRLAWFFNPLRRMMFRCPRPWKTHVRGELRKTGALRRGNALQFLQCKRGSLHLTFYAQKLIVVIFFDLVLEMSNPTFFPPLIDIRSRFTTKVRGQMGLYCVQRWSKTKGTVSSRAKQKLCNLTTIKATTIKVWAYKGAYRDSYMN